MKSYVQPEAFRAALVQFEQAAHNLSEAFDNERVNQDMASAMYPFAESFDELALKISQWKCMQFQYAEVPLWVHEHGLEAGVPSQFDALVSLGILEDCSYHNDTCPRFSRFIGGGYVVNIWVEREMPADREDADWPRYCVSLEDEGAEGPTKFDPITLYAGEDMTVALNTACNVPAVELPTGVKR